MNINQNDILDDDVIEKMIQDHNCKINNTVYNDIVDNKIIKELRKNYRKIK